MAIVNPIPVFRELTPVQRRTFLAAFLGWTLDAFDFFLVTFVVVKIAGEFHREIKEVAFAITVTLMLRPLGAIIFGYFADRYGRKIPLMVNIVFYSVVELATAFAPNYTSFIILRAIYGVAMGGEWGVGAALALEALPAKSRGFFSGLLQEGYATGYLIAALAYFALFPHFGWRGMFVAGALPALLVLYIRAYVPESPAWKAGAAAKVGDTNLLTSFLKNPLLYVTAILMMAAFNFMSHGSQDLYPTFLQKQRGYDVNFTTLAAVIANLGAIVGGTIFGAWSQSLGRKRAIIIASLVGILAIPLWAFAPNFGLLAVGGFILQFFVQGAWGVVPAHLNELSPGDVRGSFAGFTYQLGNLISAGAAQMEAAFAGNFKTPAGGDDYAHAMAIVMVIVFVAVALFTALGRERKAIEFGSAV